MPTNHVGFTVGCDWNLSKENFNKFVDNLMDNLKKKYITDNDRIDIFHLRAFVTGLHFSGLKLQKAVEYIHHTGKCVIFFELMSKSKKSKEKKSLNFRYVCGPFCIFDRRE
jgi:hypothetical protein